MKVISTTSTLALAFLLAGCQGQNPLKWQANPVGAYPTVNAAATQPYTVGQKFTPPIEPDNSQSFCDQGFSFKIDNDRGSRLMTFTEDVQQSYVIHVRSFMGNDFTITADNLPAGVNTSSSFSLIRHEGNTADYSFTWKPAKSRAATTQNTLLTLVYHSTSAKAAKCGGKIQDSINLEVSETSGEATVSYQSQFPQNKIAYGSTVKFQVWVSDPAALPNAGPDLAPTFEAWANSAEHPVLDAASAVDCLSPGTFIKDNTWQFDCSLSTLNIKDAQKLANSGKTIEAVFFLKPLSKRGKPSKASPAPHIQVEFPVTIVEKAPVLGGSEKAGIADIKVTANELRPELAHQSLKEEKLALVKIEKPAKVEAERTIVAKKVEAGANKAAKPKKEAPAKADKPTPAKPAGASAATAKPAAAAKAKIDSAKAEKPATKAKSKTEAKKVTEPAKAGADPEVKVTAKTDTKTDTKAAVKPAKAKKTKAPKDTKATKNDEKNKPLASAPAAAPGPAAATATAKDAATSKSATPTDKPAGEPLSDNKSGDNK